MSLFGDLKGISYWPYDAMVNAEGHEQTFGTLDAQTVRSVADGKLAVEQGSPPGDQGSTGAQAWRDFADALEAQKCPGVEGLPLEVAAYWAGRLGLTPPPPASPPQPHHHHWPS
jgi:hypothetical protein